MIIHNKQIAEKFEKIADLLSIKGGNEYRVRAYRNAARTIRRQGKRIQNKVEEGHDLEKLPWIGEELAGKIKTIIETGESPTLDKLKQELPEELIELTEIDGLGPKRVARLFGELDISSKEDLKEAILENKVKDLSGFGDKLVKKISRNLNKEAKEKRILIKEAEVLIEPFYNYLRSLKVVEQIKIAGSYRRKKETIGDIDILITGSDRDQIIDKFVNYEEVEKIISRGETKSTIKLKTNLTVDLRVVDDDRFASALMYFTGSKAHNVKLRKLAKDQGYKLNEYGLFLNDERKETKSEKTIFEKLGLDFISPELRENRGEIDIAQNKNKSLPKLIKLEDIKGDLQMHTNYSDGEHSLEEMIEKSIDLGYKYISLTDHSSFIGVTEGLDENEVLDYIDKIQDLDKKYPKIKLFAGLEVDILKEGELDINDEVLSRLDLVTCSIHSYFNLPEDQQTDRILKALENSFVNIFAHPTGRKIGHRAPYKYNREKVFQKAKQKNVYLEINAHPQRLDLNDINSKMAKELGAKFTISTDAHSTKELEFMKFGIYQARRGWLEKGDLINTLSLKKIEQRISSKNNY